MPLGNVYFSPQEMGGGWKDTGFILLLEVNNAGERGGIYICYNRIHPDLDEEFEGGGEEGLIPTFLGEPSSFTLAKVSPADIKKGSSSYIDLEPLKMPLHPKPTIDVVSVSNTSLELAETGMRGEWSLKNPPIPLFAVSSGTGI